MMSEEYSKLIRRSSTSRNMKPLEVWTCQRADNLKKKSSKIKKNNYAATMVWAARRQIIGGGSAPMNKSRRRGPQIVGGGGGGGARLYSITYFLGEFPGLGLALVPDVVVPEAEQKWAWSINLDSKVCPSRGRTSD